MVVLFGVKTMSDTLRHYCNFCKVKHSKCTCKEGVNKRANERALKMANKVARDLGLPP